MMAEDYVKELLDLPVALQVESIIGISYPAEFPKGIPKEELLTGKMREI
jgi:hypothetical protein